MVGWGQVTIAEKITIVEKMIGLAKLGSLPTNF